HPELARFVTTAVPTPLISGARRITNDPLSPAAGEAVPFPTLRAIAAGVPRSFPFHDIAIHFHSPEFGELNSAGTRSSEMMCGILASDSWWVNGRNRSLTACALVEADTLRQETAVACPGVGDSTFGIGQSPTYSAGAASERNQ